MEEYRAAVSAAGSWIFSAQSQRQAVKLSGVSECNSIHCHSALGLNKRGLSQGSSLEQENLGQGLLQGSDGGSARATPGAAQFCSYC